MKGKGEKVRKVKGRKGIRKPARDKIKGSKIKRESEIEKGEQKENERTKDSKLKTWKDSTKGEVRKILIKESRNEGKGKEAE